MNSVHFKNTASLLVIASLFSGCATEGFKVSRVKTEEASKAVQAEYDKGAEKFTNQAPIRTFSESDKIYVKKTSIQTPKTDFLPPVFDKKIEVTYNPRASLNDLSTLVNIATKIPVVFSPEIQPEIKNPIIHNGMSESLTVKELLDYTAAKFQGYWKYSNNEIVFFRTETKTFYVSAFQGETEFNSTIANKTMKSDSGVSSNTGQTTTFKAKTEFWKNLTNDIKLFLSKSGSYSVSEHMGMVTVTDTPKVLSEIKSFVDQINEKKTRQVNVSVRVYSVDVNKSQNYAIDWNAIYKASSRYSLSFVTPGATSGLANFSAIISGDSPFSGSSSIIGALEKQGVTALMTENMLSTISGESVPFSSVKEQGYLAQVTSTSVANAGTSVSLTPGTVTAGFSIQMLPIVMNGNEIMLQTAIDFSSIDKIERVSSGTGTNQQTIQTPEKSSKSFIGKYVMKSGETLMLTGFQQLENGYETSGLGNPDATASVLAGGGRTGKDTKRTLVVFLTPMIQERRTQ